MSMESAFRDLILDIEAVAARVEDRVRKNLAEPGDEKDEHGQIREYIVFRETTSETVEGLSQGAGLESADLQVSCWADSSESAKSLSDAVKGVLGRYSNRAVGAEIRNIQHVNGSDAFERAADGVETGYPGHNRTYRVWYPTPVAA